MEIRDRLYELRGLAVGALLGLPAPILLAALVVSVPTSLLAGLGLGVFACVVWTTRRLADAQRSRTAVPSAYRPLPTGVAARLRAVVRDPATWRDVAWLPCQFVAGLTGLVAGAGLWLGALECVAAPALRVLLPEPTGFDPAVLEWTGRSGPATWLLVPAGLALSAAAYRLPRHLVRAQTALARALLGPTSAARLTARVDRLTAARAATVDASATELRRIERDLHDGAQARLVALAMNIGVAEDLFDTDPANAKALLAEARQGAGAALTELRDLVRGIHPPVLADRGLAAAVEAVVLDTAIPVELDLRLDRRLPAPVEAAAYFATVEALTNAIRHSGAGRVRVSLVDAGPMLRIEVGDDGRGGADPSKGTGLRGIRRRLSAFDGELRITSPAGGPTMLHMDLPCAS
ncbi:sensor histidine kinase [Microbispora hainanensis]|uniref:histidine kinase n=1 Tax=Microbispora hainanensis TaxID=568844 RepID=A0A544Y3B4_9ACTN|nr:sensor histidine kinase [Microbispora hainanensis]TQS11250.1 sensor histidine kinase [Microbispora hainanensis]